MAIQKHETGIGVANDVKRIGDRLYVISNRADGYGGSFSIWSLADPLHPVLIGRLPQLGNLRQLAVQGDLALVTAREDGLLLVDITEPQAPRLLFRYDTVEFATALTVCGHYAFVGCRQYGVEAIDITDPTHPRHVSYAHAGEVQSLYCQNGLLVTGSWGEMECHLFDVSDVAHPQYLGKAELGGRGDGVFVREGLLFAATGQFPPALRAVQNVNNLAYGMGNGLDIFDITDPTQPKLLSRTNLGFPCYYPSFDNWSVYANERYAYVGHTWNGIFVYDVCNPAAPRLLENVHFPLYPGDAHYFEMKSSPLHPVRLSFDITRESRSPVTGIAVGDGLLYAATGKSDLYALSSNLFLPPTEGDISKNPAERGDFYADNPANELHDLVLLPVPEADVHNVIPAGDRLYVAGGHGGIVVLSPEGEMLLRQDTAAAVLDVGVFGDHLFAAETNRCMSVWKIEENGLVPVAEVSAEGAAIRQLVISENGRFAFLHVDSHHLWAVNITDPLHPVVELKDHHPSGLIYERQITPHAIGGRYYACHWHGTYTEWYDTAGEHVEKVGCRTNKLHFRNGMAPLGDRVLVTANDGYASADVEYEGLMADLPPYGRGLACTAGKPFVFGDRLYITDKMRSLMLKLDIANVSAPRLVQTYRFAAYIGNVSERDGRIYLAAGRQGIATGEL